MRCGDTFRDLQHLHIWISNRAVVLLNSSLSSITPMATGKLFHSSVHLYNGYLSFI